MKRFGFALAVALGLLFALAMAGCGPAQRGADATSSAPSGAANATNPPTPLPDLGKAISGLADRAVSGMTGSGAGNPGKGNFLSTRGNKIVDSEGNEVRITGVNWFGMESGTYAPHGVWARNWEEMLDQIAALGFNTVRLPYSNQLFDPRSKTGEGVDFKLNPDLKGLTGLQVLDRIIEGAGKRGLKVILDQHRPDTKDQSKLWYTSSFPEEQWINDWITLAKRYKGNDTVIAADLHNEPAGDSTWGTGDAKTDWRLAAERAGNAIQAVNPDWLIVVEGIEKRDNNKDWYWMGGNLADARQNPVRLKVPNKLVYSPHDYGPEVYLQGWFKDSSFPNNLPGVWDAHWAYLAKDGTAPLLLGEFGGRSVGDDLPGKWQRTLVNFLKDRGLSYTYWAINPNSGDTGGILEDDWKTVNKDKMALLSTYLAPKLRVANPSQVDTSAVPYEAARVKAEEPPIPEGKAAPQPGPNDPKLQVLYHANKTDSESNNPSFQIKVVNSGPVAVKLGDVELRYWFNPGAADRAEVVDIDWASIGKDAVEGKFSKADSNLDYLGLTFKEHDKMLAPDASVEIVGRIHKDDWSQYNQKSAYSFSSDGSGAQEWKRITAYLRGDLNWGVEPKVK